MSDSLLDEIIHFENEINTRIAAGKQQIRAHMESLQAELELRYSAQLERLNKHYSDRHQQQTTNAKQLREEQRRRCEVKIERENALPEQQIINCLEELFNSELRGDPDDHQNVQS